MFNVPYTILYTDAISGQVVNIVKGQVKRVKIPLFVSLFTSWLVPSI